MVNEEKVDCCHYRSGVWLYVYKREIAGQFRKVVLLQLLIMAIAVNVGKGETEDTFAKVQKK